MLPPVWNYPFTYREVKGSQLTNTEVDNNFKAVDERAEYAQTVAETLPNEIALEAANAATVAANQIASTAFVGEWVDLRPYLEAPFFWSTAREGNNSHPRIRQVAGGKVEMDGVVSFNATSGPWPLVGKICRVPEPFRPQLTSAGLAFVDTRTPLSFGTGTMIISGENDYESNGKLKGDLHIITYSGGIDIDYTGGAISINQLFWFLS